MGRYPHKHPYLITTIIFISISISVSWSAQGVVGQIPREEDDPAGPLGLNTRPKVFCRFKSKEYAPGDVWHPAPTSPIPYCVVCVCLQSGRQNCTTQDCPRDCHLDVPPGYLRHPCCNTCEDADPYFSSRVKPQFGVITPPPSVESSEGDGDDDVDLVPLENPEHVSCLHRGRIYKEGDSFMADVSGLLINAVDQCPECVCKDGMVTCEMKSCGTFKNCSGGDTTTTSSGDDEDLTMEQACCQRCATWRKSKPTHGGQDEKPVYPHRRYPSMMNMNMNNKVKDPKGDLIKDQNHQRPSSSFPLESGISFSKDGGGGGSSGGSSGSYVGGNVVDNNIGGTKDNSKRGPYDDCVSAGRFYQHGSTWHPVMGSFGQMECVICKCSKGHIDCGRLKCPAKKDMPCDKPVKVEGHCCPICTAVMSDDGYNSKYCVSNKQDITAYKSLGVGINDTELLNFAFVKERRNASPQIDLHEWSLKDGEIIQFSTKYISLDDFGEIKTRQIFTLLGATNEKNVDKFTRREKKLEKRCHTKCSPRISGLERSLRIHRLVSRKQCLLSERTVNTS